MGSPGAHFGSKLRSTKGLIVVEWFGSGVSITRVNSTKGVIIHQTCSPFLRIMSPITQSLPLDPIFHFDV